MADENKVNKSATAKVVSSPRPRPPKPLVINGVTRNDDGTEITMKQWLGEPPVYEKIDEIINADVVVVGGGLAGICAARSTAEKGAKVVIFEKMGSLQGRSGDFAIIGSELEKKWWGRDNTRYGREILNSFMRDLGWRSNYRIMKYWVENNGEAFDWYMEGLPDIYVQPNTLDPLPEDCHCWILPERFPLPREWDIETEYYKTYPVTIRIAPSHVPVMNGNFKLAEATDNCTAYFNFPVCKLLRGDDGAMTGVIAESLKDGKIIQANAKAVILATGDFVGNKEMLYYYIPWAHRDSRILMGGPDALVKFNDGDGHRMGMWIGAQMEDGPLGMINHCMGGTMGVSAFLLLNLDGERFMNEDVPGQQWENAISRQRGCKVYQIFDHNWHDQVRYMNAGHGSVIGVCQEEPYPNKYQSFRANDSYTNRANIESDIELDRCVKAATIEELVAKLDLDDEARKRALEEINRYNELCKNRYDDDFGKRSDRLFPIECGPFYASGVSTAGILATVGGLDCDHKCRVLDSERLPIPGLYAAGNIQGGRFPVEYPMTIPGISHSMCTTFGRYAGELAAEYTEKK